MNEKNLRHGAFSWGELMTTDQEAAKTFYGTLFGWQTEDMQMEGVTYTVVTAGDEPVGGIMQQPDESRDPPPCLGTLRHCRQCRCNRRHGRGLGW